MKLNIYVYPVGSVSINTHFIICVSVCSSIHQSILMHFKMSCRCQSFAFKYFLVCVLLPELLCVCRLVFSFEIKFAYSEIRILLCFDKCKHSVTIYLQEKNQKKSHGSDNLCHFLRMFKWVKFFISHFSRSQILQLTNFLVSVCAF